MIGSRLYAIGSTVLASILLFNTYVLEEQFYYFVVHIVKSKATVLILFNFCTVLLIHGFRGLRFLFFGPLKPAETQHMESHTMHHGLQFIIFLYLLNIEFD